jgi:hypothetical protein
MTAVNALLADGDERGWEVTSEAMGRIARAEDTREGVAAFFERRQPQWKGR